VNAVKSYSPPRTSGDSLDAYFRQIASAPLLTREGEITLARRIEEAELEVAYTLLDSRAAVRELVGIADDLAEDSCKKKGIHMKQGALRSEDYEPESFDIITSLGVIEHINNPCEELSRMRSLLRPGGLLYITTPNWNSVSRDLLGEKWNVISYPGHLCYYTSRTLTRVLHSHGFKKKKMEATGVSITRLRASVDRVDVKAVTASSADEKLRSRLENNKVLYRVKSMVNSLLTITGKGDELKASFVRE
jgi:SAM-dependent methyltransferase